LLVSVLVNERLLVKPGYDEDQVQLEEKQVEERGEKATTNTTF
jgi:hypothetical protein